MAYLPDLRVEIDGRSNPSIWTNPTDLEWRRIDRTNGVREYHGRKIGAPNIWTPPEPSELTLVLANINGFLDPTFSGSPYNSLLTRRRQLRVVYAPNVLSSTESTFAQGWTARSGATLVQTAEGAALDWSGANGGSALVDLVARRAAVPGKSYTATINFRAASGNPGG